MSVEWWTWWLGIGRWRDGGGRGCSGISGGNDGVRFVVVVASVVERW